VFFSVENVEKFLADKGVNGEEKEKIMKKANFFSKKGLFTDARLKSIFEESRVVADFLFLVQLDTDHKEILEAALKKAA